MHGPMNVKNKFWENALLFQYHERLLDPNVNNLNLQYKRNTFK